MRKIKLLSTLSTAILTVCTIPVFATSCSYHKSAKPAVFKKEYFNQDSRIFNPSLAAFSAYTNNASTMYVKNNDYSQGDKNIKNFWTRFGFTNFSSNDCYKIKPTENTIGCAAATMQLDNNATLVALTVRSLGYEAEWISNFNLYDPSISQTYHAGFYIAAQQALSFLKAYIQNNNLTGNIKIWLSGYSRGGATANILSGLINQAIEDGTIGTLIGNTNLKHEDLYCYCIAPPTCVDVSNSELAHEVHGEDYSNTFNIINPNDLMPLLFPYEINMDRYGIDKYICSEWTNKELYDKYKPEVIDTYANDFDSKYTIDDWTYTSALHPQETAQVFKNYAMELTTRYGVHLTGTTVGTKQVYADEMQTKILNILRESFKQSGKITADAFKQITMLFVRKSDFDLRFATTTLTIAYNFAIVGVAHSITLYISWLQTYDSNYHDNSDQLNTFIDNYSYYKVETSKFNMLQICDSLGQENQVALLKQYYTNTPESTVNSDKGAIGAYWVDSPSNEDKALTYTESYFKEKYSVWYNADVQYGQKDANITLYEITPRKFEVIESETEDINPYEIHWTRLWY